MKESKTPVIALVVALSMLIIIPIVALFVFKKSNESSESSQTSERKEVVVDFELRQLAQEAQRLVNDDFSEALQTGDISIDSVSELRDQLEKADKELAEGEVNEARSRYTDIVSNAESKLKELEFAKSARAKKELTYTELSANKALKTAFENTYSEAVDNYNQGLEDMDAGDFEASIRRFEVTDEILKELKKQSVKQLEMQLEIAQKAITDLDSKTARASFERALEIDPANKVASDGLSKVESMEAIAEEMESIISLRKSGDNKAALVKINALIEGNPGNSYLLDKRKNIESAIFEDNRNGIIEKADSAEADGDFSAAMAFLEKANKLRQDEAIVKRISQLKAKQLEKQLETLLETGYNALKAGNFEAAKKAYTQAMELDPKSKEALNGLEKTSSMYLANIRYDKSIASAAKYLDEGRVPLATKFFNEALDSRPSTLSFKQKDEEARIRNDLEAQREKVSVLLTSDGKTYVSMIGVFAPERFKEKEIMLYPDIYTVKGTRRKFLPLEFEVKVSGNMEPGGVEIKCMQKQ